MTHIPTTAEVTTLQPNAEQSRQGDGDTAITLMAVIARAAADKSVDVAKMRELLDMKLALDAREAEASFNRALARLKPRLPRITKNGTILLGGDKKIRYLKYEDVIDAVRPLLAEEGFTVSYSSELVNSGSSSMLKVVATFRHADGHRDTGCVFLPLSDKSGAKNEVQAFGSVQSYGKRYALCNYLDIVAEGEDDDGMQAGMQPITERQVSELQDLINDSGADEVKFLAYMEVKTLGEILAKDFASAKASLMDKKRRAAKK